jgi:hypothetical protein
MAGPSKTIIYQAQVTLAATLARIQAARSIIELAGGRWRFSQPILSA